MNKLILSLLAAQEAFDAGILPITFDQIYRSVNTSLDSIPADEARKIRRKFRKIWRKLVRSNIHVSSSELIKSAKIAQNTGIGNKNPTSKNIAHRKSIVHMHLEHEARKKVKEFPV